MEWINWDTKTSKTFVMLTQLFGGDIHILLCNVDNNQLRFKVSLHFYKIAVFLLVAMAHGNSSLNGIICPNFQHIYCQYPHTVVENTSWQSCEQDLIRLGSRGCWHFLPLVTLDNKIALRSKLFPTERRAKDDTLMVVETSGAKRSYATDKSAQ